MKSDFGNWICPIPSIQLPLSNSLPEQSYLFRWHWLSTCFWVCPLLVLVIWCFRFLLGSAASEWRVNWTSIFLVPKLTYKQTNSLPTKRAINIHNKSACIVWHPRIMAPFSLCLQHSQNQCDIIKANLKTNFKPLPVDVFVYLCIYCENFCLLSKK